MWLQVLGGGGRSCPFQVPAPQGISAPTSRPASMGVGVLGRVLFLWQGVQLAKLLQSHPVQGREGLMKTHSCFAL